MTMLSPFIYIIEINIFLVFFFLAYLLFFRRLTFYTWNRYYFLFSMISAMIFPGILASVHKSGTKFTSHIFTSIDSIQMITTAQHPLLEGKFLIYAFYLVSGMILFRLLITLFSVKRIHAGSVCESFQGIKYRKVQGRVAPFNFLRSIYINPDQHSKDDLINILLHERVHVQQLHTIDILLSELVTMICWFNPAAWALKAALKLNLEYVTDQAVLKKGLDAKTYQYSLLSVYKGLNTLKTVSRFSSPSIKKRIIRMNKEESNKLFLATYVFIIPFISVALLVNRSVANSLQPLLTAAANRKANTAERSINTAIFLINNQVVSKSEADQLKTSTITRISVIKGAFNNVSQTPRLNDSVFIFTNVNE